MTAHAQLMDEYHAARHADELAREASDLGYRTERAMQKADGHAQPITLKEWLRQRTERKPSPDEVWRVWAALLVDSHERVEKARAAYEEACRVRDMELHDAWSEGALSYRTMADLLGVSRTVIGTCVTRHADNQTKQRNGEGTR